MIKNLLFKNIVLVIWISFVCIISCNWAENKNDVRTRDISDQLSPILILTNGSDFGFYTGEILKAEGFNAIMIDSISGINVNLAYLKHFDLVILTETQLSGDQKKLIEKYVSKGGNLIAFRPDRELAKVFGLKNTVGTLQEGYIRIDTSLITTKGLVPESVQFHGISDLYRLSGAEKIAYLYKNATDSTVYPSVVINSYKKGRAAAFSYNLPKTIVYTRQGNPDWAGEERDSIDGPTASDLFYPLEGEKQWNDPAKMDIPQADEQMRLLTRIIEEFSTHKKPLPRLWYFPDLYSSIFIFTIDGENNTEEEIDSEIMDVQGKGGNATLYAIGTYISAAMLNKWRADGNEVAIHYDNVRNYKDPTFSSMVEVFEKMTSEFHQVYGYLPETVRNHWVIWCSKDSAGRNEFAQQAIIEENYGLGFDCNYYQFGGNNVYPNWMGDVGHFTGSGLPMKFADSGGRIINVYQSNTQLPDETWLKENIETKSKLLIDRSIDQEYYAWINANFHTWYWKECRLPGLRVLDHCNKRGVPIWTAQKAYDFIKVKDEASFSNISWIDNQLSFRLNSATMHDNGLTVMLPATFNNLKIKNIRINDEDIPVTIRTIKGSAYVMITVKPGSSYEFLALYS